MELTKKKLKELAENLSAYYYGGNVYDYENSLHTISNINRYTTIEDIEEDFKDTKYHNRKELRELLLDYANKGYRLYVGRQVAYCCSNDCGNTGQLHKVIVCENKNKQYNPVDMFFIYYC